MVNTDSAAYKAVRERIMHSVNKYVQRKCKHKHSILF